MINYAKRLREIRTKKGMSQEQVALLANITPSYYGQIERGEANPTVELLDKICRALKVPLSYIFTKSRITADDIDPISQQILCQLVGKSDKEKKIILNIIKEINSLTCPESGFDDVPE